MNAKNAQINIFDEIIIDNFAGGGGASTGIELAAGRPVTVAINHDPAAILMHKTNHPHTLHMQENVWNINPQEICAGQPVGLAWFSPDCKHFSKAKGGAPVEKNIRGLAWVVLKWAGLVKPRVIILENVEEFKTWGPIRKGKPIKSKQGQTFEKWLSQLKALGYKIEYRELVAADYGAPTTRKRFVLIARCDDKPIVWPERTHAPADSEEVKSGKYKPWRSAAEIIDWTLPCPSIFDNKEEIKEKYNLTVRRPLKDNTLRRITRGIDKFVIKSPNPFIVPIKNSIFAPLHMHNNTGAGGTDMRSPINTITTGNHQMLITPSLSKCFDGVVNNEKNSCGITDPIIAPLHMHNHSNAAGTDMRSPINTITASGYQMFIVPSLSKYFGGVVGSEIDKPLPTVTSIDHNALLAPTIAEFKGQDKGQSVNNPLRTITTSTGEFGVVYVTLAKISKDADLHYWPQIRELLNKYCDYNIADDEILLLWIGGIPYFISDIGLRMLTPKELYRAQGFPDDYIFEKDYLGNEYQKTEQVARAGNAVCPPMAAALVKANFPEWCIYDITTMAKLKEIIAV